MRRFLNPENYFTVFKEIVVLFTKHHQLTLEMTKHEIRERYMGQILGTIWAIGHPIILIGVYIFLFGYVFKTKMGGTRELPLDYTVYLLSGLIAWLSFQESMSKASTVITANSSLVKQVVFPIEILPLKGVLVSLLTQIIASSVLVLYILVQFQNLTLICFLWPIVFIAQILAMLGISYIFSAVGCYFRDLKDFVQVFSTVGMFITPIVYLPAWVPKIFKPLLYINPFSYMVWCYQDVLYFGRFEHPWAWPVFILGSLLTFYMGYRTFKKLKVSFGNVL